MNKGSLKLKVAHIVGSLNVGGAERFVIDLCSIQKQSNMKPAIISLGNPDDPLVNECKVNNIPVASYGGGSVIKILRVFIVLLKFDVIHIHSPHALKFISYILPFFNQTIIYTRHGADALAETKWIILHRKIKSYINYLTFVSHEGMTNFQQHHHWQNMSCSVIDNGVLIDPIIKEYSHLLRIGSVGRMIPLKHQISLLKAVSLLIGETQKNIELHFFGDGECLAQLESYQAKNLTGVAVNFHGMVTEREFIYSNIDVLVVTSETEGLSMVIIEAMANKIPVIATDVGGNPKLVVHGKTGWLFDYDDHQKLADHIQMLFDNDDLLVASGDNAFTYISENFSINNSAKKYAELYLQ